MELVDVPIDKGLHTNDPSRQVWSLFDDFLALK
jgi:hypothetical protein